MALISERRRRYYVDARVQAALVRQIVSYWLGVSATFGFIILLYRVFPVWISGRGPGLPLLWRELAPLLLASLVLFPMIVLSSIRFSNRFVGPMVRFRRTLRELAGEQTSCPISIRKGDFWGEVADDINRIAQRLEEARDRMPADERSDIDDPPLPNEVSTEDESSCHDHALA
jgi:hypothetical protein